MQTANEQSIVKNPLQTYKLNARLFGVFFVLTFLCYGIGSSMIEMLLTASNVFTQVNEHANNLIRHLTLPCLF